MEHVDEKNRVGAGNRVGREIQMFHDSLAFKCLSRASSDAGPQFDSSKCQFHPGRGPRGRPFSAAKPITSRRENREHVARAAS